MNALTQEQAAAKNLHITASGVLEGLTPEQIKDLEPMGIYMEYHQELVAADGQELGYFFLIIQGYFQVSKVDLDTGKKCILATIGEGQCFGEMSFFNKTPATANVMALNHVVAWAIPHSTFRQFIESRPGGATVAINVAGLLARRVQEGNTRLLGLNSTLSAYFGNASRKTTPKNIEAPQSGEFAEMEISDEIFDQFACETLGIQKIEELTAEQRKTVRSRIEANEIDIVPWLESGGEGKNLKVRLKFVQDEPAPRVAVAAETPAVSKKSAQPTVVRVPQVRARIAPQVAYVEAPPSRKWLWINIASWLIAPFLIAYSIFNYMPLDSRLSMVSSPGFQKLPFQSFLNSMVFHHKVQTATVNLKKGTPHILDHTMPIQVHATAMIRLKDQTAPTQIHVKVKSKNAKDFIVDQDMVISTSGESAQIFSAKMDAGGYQFEFTCLDGETQLGELTLNMRY